MGMWRLGITVGNNITGRKMSCDCRRPVHVTASRSCSGSPWRIECVMKLHYGLKVLSCFKPLRSAPAVGHSWGEVFSTCCSLISGCEGTRSVYAYGDLKRCLVLVIQLYQDTTMLVRLPSFWEFDLMMRRAITGNLFNTVGYSLVWTKYVGVIW